MALTDETEIAEMINKLKSKMSFSPYGTSPKLLLKLCVNVLGEPITLIELYLTSVKYSETLEERLTPRSYLINSRLLRDQ